MIDYARKDYDRAAARAEWRDFWRWALRRLVALHIIAFWIGALALAQWVDDRAIAEQATAAEKRASVTLADCPPPAPGTSDTLVMVVRSTADDRPALQSCFRIAERSFAAGLRSKP